MGFLAGKRALIVGLATERSIAYGIAAAMQREGAELAFTYQSDRLKDRVVEMAQGFGSVTTCCRWTSARDAEIDAAFAAVRAVWDSLDILVHSVAFAPREQLAGGFLDSIDARGLPDRARHLELQPHGARQGRRPLMLGRAGAILTLSYLGAVRSIPSYNVMGLAKASLEANVRFLAADLGPQGIRVNAISAGPDQDAGGGRRRAGSARCSATSPRCTPLRRNVTTEEVGNAAAFLCSDLASGITGEVLYVDAGYSHVGMAFAE